MNNNPSNKELESALDALRFYADKSNYKVDETFGLFADSSPIDRDEGRYAREILCEIKRVTP